MTLFSSKVFVSFITFTITSRMIFLVCVLRVTSSIKTRGVFFCSSFYSQCPAQVRHEAAVLWSAVHFLPQSFLLSCNIRSRLYSEDSAKHPRTISPLPIVQRRSLTVKFYGRQGGVSHFHRSSFNLFPFCFIHLEEPSFLLFSLCPIISKPEENSPNEPKTGSQIKGRKTHSIKGKEDSVSVKSVP